MSQHVKMPRHGIWVLVAGWTVLIHASPLAAADYDATFVRMEVPDRVMAREVFAVTITLQNTGTMPWEGSPVRLRFVNPRNDLSWGTDYILIAQGTTVRPGEEYSFRSNLRAPGSPGKVRFQWQVCKDAERWFGQPTPERTVEVVARPAAVGPAVAPATEPTLRRPGEKAVLKSSDFEYAGSFKPPRTVKDARGAFSESGLAFRHRNVPDGRDRLLVNYTHPTQVLFELEIPELVKVEDGNHAALSSAEVKKVWGSLRMAQPDGETLSPNGGFVWIEKTSTLVWTWYHGYKTGDAPPVLGATKLSDDGQVTCFGPWRVVAPGGLYKSYWGGVIQLPAAFADKYTGGKTLALGFGGYYSICAPASRGPALGAIPDPDPRQASVPVTSLLHHPHDAPAVRDGDYLNANCGFWSDQPESLERGTWTYDDWCRAGAFVDLMEGHAYIAFVRLGTGRLGYDFGAITSAGSADCWYFYDPADLGDAAAGKRPPWKTAPSSRAKVEYPLGRTVTGACFDARARRLYLCVSSAYPEGLETYPVIHVYRVK
jgi:hypothetical protein